LFGEPALNLEDLIQTDDRGRGVINILAAETLMQQPKLYATLLLWLLAELFENLPEAGDVEKPRLVFFFEEAHLLFEDAPKVLLQKIEQVMRLIRSKGVGVYFVPQNPHDTPDDVLGQLGNRMQHALRAFTPRDQKAVKAAADTFRSNPKLRVDQVITELGVGEALVSLRDAKGSPMPGERAFVLPPHSRIGPPTTAERAAVLQALSLAGHYETAIDRESAYEIRKSRKAASATVPSSGSHMDDLILVGSTGGGRRREGLVEAMTKSAARTVGSQISRQIMRGVLGSLLGGRR